MILTAALATLVAIPAVFAQTQDVSSSATRCTTRYGYEPASTGTAGTAAIPTWYKYTTTTNVFRVTYTTRDTVTVTPSATTFTDVVTTTNTVSTTTTYTPPASTVPTPAGFMNLLQGPLAHPTQVSRVKRHTLDAREVESALQMFKRQTAANNTGGYSVNRDGESSDIFQKYPLEVRCRVSVTVNSTITTIVTGSPDTVVAAGPTARVVSTSTVSTTTTITAVAPRRTEYAACGPDNVVNSVIGFNDEPLIFYRIEYGNESGFPIENKLIVNTTSAENCCIACQNTAYCAASFYVPRISECHLHLTQTPSLALPASAQYANGTAATATGAGHATETLALAVGTGVSSAVGPLSTASANLSTCSKGSNELYIGTIEGEEDFPEEYALSFSNGPCGYLGIYPLPVPEGQLVNPVEADKMRRALI